MTLSLACCRKRFSKGSILKIALWVAPRALSESDMPVFNIRSQGASASQTSHNPNHSTTSSMNASGSITGSHTSRTSAQIAAQQQQQQQQQYRRQMGEINAQSGSITLASNTLSPASQKKKVDDYLNSNSQGGVYANVEPGGFESGGGRDIYANVTPAAVPTNNRNSYTGPSSSTNSTLNGSRAIKHTTSMASLSSQARSGSGVLTKHNTAGSTGTGTGEGEYLNADQIRALEQDAHAHTHTHTRKKSRELTNEITDLRTQLANRPKVPSRENVVGEMLRIPKTLVLANARECRAFHDFSHIADHGERRKVIGAIMQTSPSGSWLLRYNREKGVFVITVKYEQKTYHFPMHKPDTSDGSVKYALAEGEPHHDDPSTLLSYYITHSLPLNVDTCLLHAVLRRDLEDEEMSSSDYANIWSLPKTPSRPNVPERGAPVPKAKPRVPIVDR